MTANQGIPNRKRRSRAEIKRLVSEFEKSGLRLATFCRSHGLAERFRSNAARSFSMPSRERQEVPRKLKERMLQTLSSTKSGSCEASAESLADH